MRVYFLLFFVCNSVLAGGDNESDQFEEQRQKILDKLSRTRTELLDDYHLVCRQVNQDIMVFKSYRSVIIIGYSIPKEVAVARFAFQSELIQLNNIGSCTPKEIHIDLKHGSFPAINPSGYKFPKHFINTALRERIHTIRLDSNGVNKTYIIENPKPGNWYALVYLKWEDPKMQHVTQQGLVAYCSSILYADLQIKKEKDVNLIDCYSDFTLDYNIIPANFKCMSMDANEAIHLKLAISNTDINSTKILVRVQALSMPTEDDYILACVFDPLLSNVQTIVFSAHPNAWHYMSFFYIDRQGNTSMLANCESYYYRADYEDVENNTVHDLMRDDLGRYFTFDYGMPSTDMKESTSLLNLTSNEIETVRFTIKPFVDIGGTLSIEVSLIMSLKYYTGFRKQIKRGGLHAFTKEDQFFKVVVCLDIGYISVPLHNGYCKYNDHVRPALFVLNSTDSESIYDKVYIPYPDSGTWYLTARLFCDDTVCPCRTSQDGTRYYVQSGGEMDEGEDISTEFSNETRVGDKSCKVSVLVGISSSPCINNRCGFNGHCMLNTFAGFMTSFCTCSAGFGGWDCSDGSRMVSIRSMMTSVLLLTLSNLTFIFSIYIGIIRHYYTEALMFTFTMLFSTFYHACDASFKVHYCIMMPNVLQFADFYCGLMSFWMVLLAMSILNEKLRSTLQLSGAIIIAVATAWNMRSIHAFLVPVVVGTLILLGSWVWSLVKTKRMIYPRTYYTIYLPLGIALVLTGLICYAFLQTEQNYLIVHSVWHMIIATSVIFLLPDVKRGDNVNPFLPKNLFLSCRTSNSRASDGHDKTRTPSSSDTTDKTRTSSSTESSYDKSHTINVADTHDKANSPTGTLGATNIPNATGSQTRNRTQNTERR